MSALYHLPLMEIAIILLLSISQAHSWMLHPSCTNDPLMRDVITKAINSAIEMAGDAATELNKPDASLDPNVKDLGTYLFGNTVNTRLAGVFLGRVANGFGQEDEYVNDHLWANMLIFCNTDHWEPAYRTINMVGAPPVQERKPGEVSSGSKHIIDMDEAGVKQCGGTLATYAAFVVNTGVRYRLLVGKQSYMQLCPWYLRKINASPYQGSWAVKRWDMFVTASRGVVQTLLGSRTAMDAAARLDHTLVHEFTHADIVVPKCIKDEANCASDTMPISVSVTGGSRDIPSGWIPKLSEFKSYFWPNCVAKANNPGWDNGVYNADNLAYAALGVRQIKNGNRVEKSGTLTAIASLKARALKFLGLGAN
ncbi:hypothetical protein BGZ63DRAFT_393194 [Mariannaea sp. PMI_226]|nr:hypothetical protein BGZ63DRAFT_393194 [Mariannaea sp. PMI_226]